NTVTEHCSTPLKNKQNAQQIDHRLEISYEKTEQSQDRTRPHLTCSCLSDDDNCRSTYGPCWACRSAIRSLASSTRRIRQCKLFPTESRKQQRMVDAWKFSSGLCPDC